MDAATTSASAERVRLPQFSPQQIASFNFERLVDDTGAGTGYWRCKTCAKAYKQEDGRGVSNLVQHTRNQHPGYAELMAASYVNGTLRPWISQRAVNRMGWIDWIADLNLPLNFCEQEITRRNSTLTPVSTKTLRNTMLRLTTAVEGKIAREMPEKFGLIFDGWTHGSEHYLAIYATYDIDGTVYTPLLSLAPVINEPDENHNAETHRLAIQTVLSFFDKTLEQCVFLVGDNCSLNKRLARIMGVPLVGCASHRLNLAVRLLTQPLEAELDAIQALMVKLRTLNQAAKLRFKTELHPVLRQDTRWGSTFRMLLRYFELLPFLDRDDDTIADLLPSAATTKKLKLLLENLRNVESVSKAIQAQAVSMWDVRVLFDALIDQFPVFAQYIGATAPIVGDAVFEAAVVKVQSGRTRLLNRAERQALASFRASAPVPLGEDDGVSFAERVLKKARVGERDERFVLIPAVAPTSNVVERLFSCARATVGLGRHALQPIMLEALLFLKCNRALWDVSTVHSCLEDSP